MAGGEGTRLRPLTSNQPKPMVPVAGKPCMQHIIELLRRHGMTDIVVTVAYLPQVIRGYFDDGEALGVELHYSVEERPLGTAGSVKNAEELLDETFLVISGDALCDFDLDALIQTHKSSGVAATLALKSVDNPLEFGVVILDSDGRVERFLEKPSWGQVFSDTINTGVYVLEPEVLRAVPPGMPYDFSKQLFPDLLERGKPILGHVEQGYWQDIGNLDQYRQANFDALDGRVELELSGIRLRDNVLLGEGVQLPDLEQIEGPAFIGNFCQIDAGARVGPYTVLGPNVVVKEGATVVRSMVDSGSYVGRSARLEGTILGKGVDVRAHAVLNDGVAVGDECSIGAEAVLAPGRQGVPVQDDRGGRGDQRQPDLGVARHHDALRPRRRRRARERRRHVRGRRPARRRLRHDAPAGRAGRVQPRRAPLVADGEAGDHRGPRLDRRARRRPARRASHREPARAEGGGAGRRPACARRHGRPRRRPDQLLRAARDPGGRLGPEGDRADVLAAGVPAGEPGRDRLPDLPGPRHRELRPGAPEHA